MKEKINNSLEKIKSYQTYWKPPLDDSQKTFLLIIGGSIGLGVLSQLLCNKYFDFKFRDVD